MRHPTVGHGPFTCLHRPLPVGGDPAALLFRPSFQAGPLTQGPVAVDTSQVGRKAEVTTHAAPGLLRVTHHPTGPR